MNEMEAAKYEHLDASSTLQLDTRDNYTEVQKHPTGYPYHAYEAAKAEPCAVHADGYILPIHMLTCGHLVAIDSPLTGSSDNRCGLNCLHVAHWIKQQTDNATAQNADLRADQSCEQVLTSSTTLKSTTDPVLPAITQHQSRDNIYCEICHGLPAGSYFVVPRDVRRALAFTRPVIEHFCGLASEEIVNQLCRPFYNPDKLGYDWKLTHILRCGHQVWAQPARPCAANCSDTPECKSRIFPGNNQQGDVIFCYECVYRAEIVYARYAQAGRDLTRRSESQTGLQGVLVPGNAQHVPQPQVVPTYEVADPISGSYLEYRSADGFPFDPVSEEGSSMSSSGA
ncbi:uncharacterized protein CC84DRAFT_867570 [Paraphaeosphaeria sporulosa]|uniref:Uncharacterized protein n=1 Tax=Paraphaeosphaeria sporulosa TaxID=1460663 RepID=A0A177C9L2_9PLEO|nr:uncharacterized protein CC84DRAFT_867570 [Paraphaeosphaeria sporulosa]OAG03811.1 hypothetical protein CC84DRAFT_867570 [Paraphaeosphaeria sporulosa]